MWRSCPSGEILEGYWSTGDNYVRALVELLGETGVLSATSVSAGGKFAELTQS